MTAERWAQVKAVFDRAVQCDPALRPQLIRECCGVDEALRDEVESLLACDQPTGSLAGNHWIDLEVSDGAPISLPEDTFGPYTPTRLIGEGGMGRVYLARQEQPIRREVALKLVKGGTGAREVIERFGIERQALAMMNHPNVARVFDAGTSDRGQPYFAMEYVDGIPITRYCDDKALSTRERLGLFIPVCNALQHAHTRGIIHRDVKPSNVLVAEVDGKPVPKVIDFGVARATEPRSSGFTAAGQVMGTPAYMSPEQAGVDSGDIDTTTDVYSLGMVLYELLAGTLPLDLEELRKLAVAQALRAVQEMAVPRPTTRISQMGAAAEQIARRRRTDLGQLKRELSGDLDWIVMKAVDKDRARRYASPLDFARDLERHLKNEPVLAGPPGAAYRVRKFAVRYKRPVAAAALVVFALIGGLITTARQARVASQQKAEADRQRVRAEQEAQELARQRDAAQAARTRALAAETRAQQERNEAVAQKRRADNEAAIATAVDDFLQNDVLAQASASSQARPDTKPDPDLKVRTALDRAAARIPGKFATQPLVEASLRMTIGQSYRELGLFSESQREYERAVELRRRVLGDANSETLAAMNDLAGVLRDLGRYAQAEPLVSEVLDIRRRTRGDWDPDTLKTMSDMATLYQVQGKYRQAEALAAKVLERSRRVRGEQHIDTMVAMHNLGLLYLVDGKYTDAEPLLTKAFELYRRELGEDHPDTLTVLDTLGALYRRKEDYARAELVLSRGLELRRRVLGKQHPDTLGTMNNLASLYQLEGKYSEAEPLHRDVLEARRTLLGPEHPSTLIAMGNLGLLYLRERKYAQAEALLANTLEGQRRVLGEQHPATLRTMQNLAATYLKEDKYADGEALLVKALDIGRRSQGPQHVDTTARMEVLGGLWLEQGKNSEAESILRGALDSYEKLPDRWERYLVQSRLGASLAGQRKYAEAEPLLLSGYQGLLRRRSAIPKDQISELDVARDRILQLYRDWGRPERRSEWEARIARELTHDKI